MDQLYTMLAEMDAGGCMAVIEEHGKGSHILNTMLGGDMCRVCSKVTPGTWSLAHDIGLGLRIAELVSRVTLFPKLPRLFSSLNFL